MDLICYDRMSTRSKRCMKRRWDKKQKTVKKAYHYQPRAELVGNLAYELGLTEAQVRAQIRRERLYLLRQDWGEDAIQSWEI